ncbi:phosphate signaling complex protein PhoU [Deinococcus peraridilitoris]|uniref:Phosphate-specific transport system accessory protein PhoU n=1 Tax=Deinococcus peraridilitoris (strain DSM 19664 / LMG 22246 / CIP 109416 / KR-200) TaxID=937777 RepID=K9ZZJ5_DEIPD|nr:phosphate signaling complex protein PhoU [Deinococcus peraridilitoris]AFZ66362.1 phosphate transport system regulatory protein PhoU [Deinococcus peraridilitoris DSM 19664]
MREALEHDLRSILEGALEMLDVVARQLDFARASLIERDTGALANARALDKEVDAMETRIEAECLRVIALHQPVARDLRLIALILKSLTDIERMGDYVVHVAEDGVELAQETALKKYINLARMLERLGEMIDSLKRTIRERNVELARATLEMDDEVDDLYEQIQRELVTYMLEDPRTIGKAITLMRVGRSLERVGDHIENVAERVNYWVTGQRT